MIFTQISNNSTTKPHRSSCGHALKYHRWEMQFSSCCFLLLFFVVVFCFFCCCFLCLLLLFFVSFVVVFCFFCCCFLCLLLLFFVSFVVVFCFFCCCFLYIYFCYNKSLLQQTCVCCGKSILAVTKLLSRLFFSPHVLAVCHDQKILSRQLPQKKCCHDFFLSSCACCLSWPKNTVATIATKKVLSRHAYFCQNKWRVSSWQKICFVMTNPCLLQQTFVMTKIMHDTCGSSHQWYSSGMHRSNSTEDWHPERFEWFPKWHAQVKLNRRLTSWKVWMIS